MSLEPLEANNDAKLEQACKDANIALTLAIISIYGSTIPLLGIVTALVAERIANKTPDVRGVSNVRTKKNVVHYLTPFTFLLSIFFFSFYYYLYNHHSWF
ncbi:MAG TPA: hypothetical protein VIJ68_02125 [Candidatus Saccharimonadales bacterium]